MSVPHNNPGNLRFIASIKWLGQIGADRGFCVFDGINNGARALAIDLLNAQQIHHLTTIAQIINTYAPTNENDTAAYIAAVSLETGFGRNDMLNLKLKSTLTSLVCAVWHHEQGQRPDLAAVDYGVAAALA